MSRRCNILHLFTDQQRFDTIRRLGNPVIKTPNLDRLCESGVAFTNAFSPSPVCVAARCSMIYGQYPMHTGLYSNGPMPNDDRQSFMAALADAGYRTHGIGKCHFAPDRYALRGFHTREVLEEGGGRPETDPYIKELYDKGYTHICEPHGVRGEMYYIPQPSQLPWELHPTQWVGDRSIAFIREQAHSDRPWYLFAGFIHPHPPFAPPNPWHKLYRAPLMPLPHMPADAESLHTYVNAYQNRYKYRDQGIDHNLLRCIKAYYYACISFVDYQIGRILDALEDSGQSENTLILFTSDHGEYLGDYGCFGKRGMHDASARVPFIVRWPGRFEGGLICDRPVSLVDVAPTFLSAAGASFRTHEPDGVDVADILSGASDREMVFSHFAFPKLPPVFRRAGTSVEDRQDPALQRASLSLYMGVSKEWKYVYSAADNREYLFDRVRDPLETRNRAGLPFCEKALSAMRRAVMEHLKAGGETAGIDGDRWREFPKVEMIDDPDLGLLVQDHYTSWTNTHIPGYSDS